MPKKLNNSISYGEKLISLFALLLFTGENYSLKELSRKLNCSKQTILRLVENIKNSCSVDIEEYLKERQKYFYIKSPGRIPPAIFLTEMEMNVLHMCRAFSKQLLGEKLFEESTRALLKSQVLLDKWGKFQHFDSFRPGSVDYTPYQDIIRTLIEAMKEKKVCKISYQSIWSEKAKTFYTQPLKIFSRHDTVYLHARKARTPGKPYKEPAFAPLLVIHRIKEVEKTDRFFEFPKDYDFEKIFNEQFGVIKKEPFKVDVEFIGWAARYAAERIWSPDQKIEKKADGKIILSFTASSESELISWVLSFRDEARLLKPAWLVTKVKDKLKMMMEAYADSP